MRIGVPTEIKNNEYRVALTPSSVKSLTDKNHNLFIQSGAGDAIGFIDDDYVKSGATILDTANEIYANSELIVKVKEPMPSEFKYLTSKHTLFTYLHLAGNKEQALDLMNTGVTGIAYETVTADDGSMPLLAPMSAIAGQLSIVVGSYHLLKPNNGMGTLIGSFGNVKPRIVTVIGAGVAGTQAIEQAIVNKAIVRIIDLSKERLDKLKSIYGETNIEYIISSDESIEDALSDSDLVIGAVYVIGMEAPKVIKRSMLRSMKSGAVLVDISIDQGGCIESSRPTNHDNPTFIEEGIVHYCVTNMPGAVPLTATEALNQATLSYIHELADKGIDKALDQNIHLANGLNIQNGKAIHPAIREIMELNL